MNRVPVGSTIHGTDASSTQSVRTLPYRVVDPRAAEVRHVSVDLDGVQPSADPVPCLDDDAVDPGGRERVRHGETGDAGPDDDHPLGLTRELGRDLGGTVVEGAGGHS